MLLVIQIDVLENPSDVAQDSLFFIFVSRNRVLGIQTKVLLALVTAHYSSHNANIGAQKYVVNY